MQVSLFLPVFVCCKVFSDRLRHDTQVVVLMLITVLIMLRKSYSFSMFSFLLVCYSSVTEGRTQHRGLILNLLLKSLTVALRRGLFKGF